MPGGRVISMMLHPKRVFFRFATAYTQPASHARARMICALVCL